MGQEESQANETAERTGVIGLVRHGVSIVAENQINGFAQMVAYNILFATAPLLMVVTAGAAFVTQTINSDLENPAQPILEWVQDVLPTETAAFLEQPIERAVNADISWFFSIGAVFALWGARGAVAAIIRGLNNAYGIGKDPRPFALQVLRSLGLMFLLVLMIAAAGLVFTLGTEVGERIASTIGLGDLWLTVSAIVRWPTIGVISVLVVMTLHRYGPAVKDPFKWYLPGSLFSVVAMYLTTLALGLWFAEGGGFSETYGVFGSVLAFVLWLYLMALMLLLGGVINAVLHNEFLVRETSGCGT